MKGRCPRPLDERDAHGEQSVAYCKLVKLPYRSDAVKRRDLAVDFQRINADLKVMVIEFDRSIRRGKQSIPKRGSVGSFWFTAT